MKKFFGVVLVLSLSFLTVACGGEKTKESAKTEDIAGVAVDNEKIQLLCPGGWQKEPSSQSSVGEKIKLYKGEAYQDVAAYEAAGLAAGSPFSTASISYFEEGLDEEAYKKEVEETKEFYKSMGADVLELAVVTAGDKTYSGYSYIHKPGDVELNNIILYRYIEERRIEVIFVLTDKNLTVESADILAILSEIEEIPATVKEVAELKGNSHVPEFLQNSVGDLGPTSDDNTENGRYTFAWSGMFFEVSKRDFKDYIQYLNNNGAENYTETYEGNIVEFNEDWGVLRLEYEDYENRMIFSIKSLI